MAGEILARHVVVEHCFETRMLSADDILAVGIESDFALGLVPKPGAPVRV